MEPSIKDLTEIDGNSTSYSINGIRVKARIRVEQDIVLLIMVLLLKKTLASTWWSAADNRQLIQALHSETWSYQPRRWTVIPKSLQINWLQQTLPNSHTEKNCWRSLLEPARRIWKTSRNHQDENCPQTKRLVSKHGVADQEWGGLVWPVCEKITNQQQTQPPANEKP